MHRLRSSLFLSSINNCRIAKATLLPSHTRTSHSCSCHWNFQPPIILLAGYSSETCTL